LVGFNNFLCPPEKPRNAGKAKDSFPPPTAMTRENPWRLCHRNVGKIGLFERLLVGKKNGTIWCHAHLMMSIQKRAVFHSIILSQGSQKLGLRAPDFNEVERILRFGAGTMEGQPSMFLQK